MAGKWGFYGTVRDGGGEAIRFGLLILLLSLCPALFAMRSDGQQTSDCLAGSCLWQQAEVAEAAA